ncbi:MAG: KilA-N domain-containing protein [Methylobacter sp.]|uniref:KilA-N domain-containing protein n=1 Tax=Methylobacter sp. TaxID=2051955 RepID=UPI00272F44C6|nr:KilA-N domain-containing protein [Methylobacter sp.]MDP1664115.1 KilA-N domain-containing protein [Methylobacter sp.]
MNALTLTISNTPIKQDHAGRFCLNDLHKASGNQNKHRPSLWLKNQQAIDLIDEIARAGIPALEQNQPVKTINGGNQQGTFVVKELVYAYAMWISPAFSLKVIRTFDVLVTGQQQPTLPSNDYSTLQSKYITLLEQEINRLKATAVPLPAPVSKYKQWTQEEDAIIREKRKEGWGAHRIRHVLGRSVDSVEHRIRRLEGKA